MSIYLGTDTAGSKILHLTNGQHTVEQMKNPSAATVFHSSLEYLTFTAYSGTLSAAANSYKLLTVSVADRAAIGTRGIFIVDSNGVMIDAQLRYSYTVYPNQLYTEWEGMWVNNTMSLVPDAGTVIGPCTVYALNIYDGNYSPPVKSNNEIVVGNNRLIVNGVDISAFNYIHSTPVNIVDKTATLASRTFQMINSSAAGGMSIYSSYGNSQIAKGGVPLFSTTIGQSVRHLYSTTYTLPAENSFTTTYTLPVALSSSGFVALTPGYGSTQGSTTVFIPINIPQRLYQTVYMAFPDFGALLWYYDYVTSSLNSITLTRQVISSTGGLKSASSLIHVSVFG